MAMNDQQAAGFAREILLAMAQSGSLKTVGPASGTGADEERNAKRGVNDASYLASLYRDLVTGFQK